MDQNLMLCTQGQKLHNYWPEDLNLKEGSKRQSLRMALKVNSSVQESPATALSTLNLLF